MDDGLMAMDAKRRNHMDGKTFDALLKLSATRGGRRRLFQAVAAAGIGGLLTRGGAAAEDVVAQACEPIQGQCERARQCKCKVTGETDRQCRRLKRGCRRRDRRTRCCGVSDSSCRNQCDCCPGYNCRNNTCRRN
jgi:hypothetical protein